MALLHVSQSAVNAARRLPVPVAHLDVLQRVPQRPSPAVAHGHVPLHLDGGHLLDKLEGVRAVLPQLVLRRVNIDQYKSDISERQGIITAAAAVGLECICKGRLVLQHRLTSLSVRDMRLRLLSSPLMTESGTDDTGVDSALRERVRAAAGRGASRRRRREGTIVR